MKIALIADSHLGARNDSLVIADYFAKFYEKCFFPYIDEHNIDTIIHLGDVFDRRKYTNHLTLSRAKEYFFDPLKARDLDVHIILGNHDSTYRNTLAVNSPMLLLRDYKFNIYSEPTYAHFDGLKILMLPWITPENQEKSMSMIAEAQAKIIMGHLEIQGYEMLRGRPAEHGLNRSIFDAYLSVFSGHFHFKSYSNGIMYLGTPYEMTWADHDVPKGFHILDTETLTIDFIENPYKLFKKIYYDDTNGDPEFDSSTIDNSYVKVIVQNKTNPVWFEKFIDRLNKTNAANVIVVEEPLFRAESHAQDGNFEVEDTLTFITKYIKNSDQKLTVAKDNVLKLFQDLYQKANELEL
jgi:DNA repair exonuclease SbcCD nuclease subunit